MALIPPPQLMGMDVEGGMGMDMGGDMMMDADLYQEPEPPARPWFSTTAILFLCGIFLITLCGIVGTVVFLSVLKTRAQGPSEAPEPTTLKSDDEAARIVALFENIRKPPGKLSYLAPGVSGALDVSA
ncbi:uncharacterized protein LOC135370312 [Ornithodoros turicata]|uniref:uncharacterized protein LOC135370312 n=1 Tax=Ornithodoros turicata TaxID=34597 RepID=UPI0031389780